MEDSWKLIAQETLDRTRTIKSRSNRRTNCYIEERDFRLISFFDYKEGLKQRTMGLNSPVIIPMSQKRRDYVERAGKYHYRLSHSEPSIH